MERKIRVTAPAKLILFGEHSVVYGKHALACAIGLTTTTNCIIRPRLGESTSPIISLKMVKRKEPWAYYSLESIARAQEQLQRSISDDDKPKAAFFRIIDRIKQTKHYKFNDFQNLSMELKVESDVPIGSGLGSSASLSVSMAGALSFAIGNPENQGIKEINALAFESERIFHSNPSGVDNTVCSFGGAILFSKSMIKRLETIPSGLKVVIIDTRITRSTKDIVLQVAERLNKLIPPEKEEILNRFDEIALRATELLENWNDGNDDKSFKELENLIDLNQHLLKDEFNVSHPAIEKVIGIAQQFGLHAKLTGAGCGGCVFALIPTSFTPIQELCLLEKFIQSGFSAFPATLGVGGVSTMPASL